MTIEKAPRNYRGRGYACIDLESRKVTFVMPPETGSPAFDRKYFGCKSNRNIRGNAVYFYGVRYVFHQKLLEHVRKLETLCEADLTFEKILQAGKTAANCSTR